MVRTDDKKGRFSLIYIKKKMGNRKVDGKVDRLVHRICWLKQVESDRIEHIIYFLFYFSLFSCRYSILPRSSFITSFLDVYSLIYIAAEPLYDVRLEHHTIWKRSRPSVSLSIQRENTSALEAKRFRCTGIVSIYSVAMAPIYYSVQMRFLTGTFLLLYFHA